MRRIDLTPYKIDLGGSNGKVEDRLNELLLAPPLAVLKRLAVERLAVPETEFLALVMEEAKKPDPPSSPDYDLRGSIIEILFHPNLQLGAKDLLDRDTLARRIKDWPDNDLLLEEEEYKKVLAGLEVLRGLQRHDVQFVRRVLDAPKVEVTAQTPAAKP